jgi:hypothetical protein
MCGVGYEVAQGRVVHSGRRLMGDPERAAVARYKVESQELLRDHRRLAARLELVDRALDQCTDPDRQEELRAERVRITEVLGDTRKRLRACWDRSRIKARRGE